MGLFSRAQTFEFKVSGMDCGGCERKITKALNEVSGVKKVDASAREGTVVVKAKGVESGQITDKIVSVGFTVE
tara:strand:+ start:1064 stop:1282 length:219 start_codon:yes stop_codon:yes gene_type:complete